MAELYPKIMVLDRSIVGCHTPPQRGGMMSNPDHIVRLDEERRNQSAMGQQTQARSKR
jgi:hypothetical protein